MLTIKEKDLQEMFERYIRRKRYNQNCASDSQDGLWSAGECSEAEKWLRLFGVDLSYGRIQPMVDGRKDVKVFDN